MKSHDFRFAVKKKREEKRRRKEKRRKRKKEKKKGEKKKEKENDIVKRVHSKIVGPTCERRPPRARAKRAAGDDARCYKWVQNMSASPGRDEKVS